MKSVFYSFISQKHFLLLFALLGTASVAFAQVNKATLSVQGVLTKSDGTAVDDGNDYKLTFRLWDDESSTNNVNKVHQELIENITVVGGVYSVVLGLDDAQPLNAPFNKTYWLGVSVGTSSIELLPRPRLTHAPYALGLVGQNNTFPSTGPVIGDAFRARGGDPIGGQGADGNGYSFKSDWDQGGGMFSRGANNIEFWAGGAHKVKLTSGLNELYGKTNTNELEVFGDQKVNGNSTITLHQTVQGFQTVNGFQKINNNQEVTGFSTVGANQTVNGIVKSGDGIVNKALTNTGMFWSAGNHDINFVLNGENRFLIGANGYNYHTGGEVFTLGAGDLFIHGVKPKGTTGNPRNIAIDLSSGRIFEESSSRRYKKNIRPLQDNFSLLLKIEPRIYNRFEDPADIDTSKYYELGYIAEEIDSIGLHKLVQYNNEGQIDGVNYDKMILYAVEVLKMQDAALKQLQTEVNVLKAENSGLKAEKQTLISNYTDLKSQQIEYTGQLESLLKRIQALESSNTRK